MRSFCANLTCRLSIAVATLLIASPVFSQDIVYQISEPSDGNQGTFTVSLDHSVAIAGMNCEFGTLSQFTVVIEGQGFEVSNVVLTDENDFLQSPLAGGGNFFAWARFFTANAVIANRSEISGPLFSFDVNFVDGVENAFYTIGQAAPSGMYDIECFDENGLVISTGGGDYFDSFGGRTFVNKVFVLGDINGDGVVDLLDVAGFIDLILNNEFQAEGDINGDGVVDLLDVSGFINLILG